MNQDFQMNVQIICKLHIAKENKQQLTYIQGLKKEKRTPSNVSVSTKFP